MKSKKTRKELASQFGSFLPAEWDRYRLFLNPNAKPNTRENELGDVYNEKICRG